MIKWVITAYCACVLCTGKYHGRNMTKTGVPPGANWTAACDPKTMPLRSIIYIDGIGVRQCEDVGSAIKGRRVDLFFDSHKEAQHFGVKRKRVELLFLVEKVNGSYQIIRPGRGPIGGRDQGPREDQQVRPRSDRFALR